MGTKNGLVNFGLFVVILAFSFVFALDALSTGNVFYGVLALFGFIVGVAGSLFNGILAKRDGDALTLWYFVYAVITSIILVWYITMSLTALKIW